MWFDVISSIVLRTEIALAVQLATVHEHRRELRVVLGGADETAGAREVRRAAQAVLIGQLLQTVLRAAIERDDARGAIGQEREPGVLHAERIEEALFQEAIERLSRRDLDDAAEDVEPGEPAVTPQRAGLESRAPFAPSFGMYVASVSSGARCASDADARWPRPPLISPEPCVSRSRTVISRDRRNQIDFHRWTAATAPDHRLRGSGAASDPGFGTATFIPLNSGMNRDTGSVSRSLPSSTIIITATAVTGFDIEASRKMPSFGMGRLVSMSMRPCASWCAMRPLRTTIVTAPAMDLGVDVALHGVVDAREPLRREPELLGFAGDNRARLQRHGQDGTGNDHGKERRIRR